MACWLPIGNHTTAQNRRNTNNRPHSTSCQSATNTPLPKPARASNTNQPQPHQPRPGPHIHPGAPPAPAIHPNRARLGHTPSISGLLQWHVGCQSATNRQRKIAGIPTTAHAQLVANRQPTRQCQNQQTARATNISSNTANNNNTDKPTPTATGPATLVPSESALAYPHTSPGPATPHQYPVSANGILVANRQPSDGTGPPKSRQPPTFH